MTPKELKQDIIEMLSGALHSIADDVNEGKNVRLDDLNYITSELLFLKMLE